MKLIIKRSEPNSLTQFRNAGGTWDSFSLSNGKEELKEQLLEEQKHLCAYCNGRIKFEDMKVEHWCSRSLCPDNRELDYSNLFGVCKGRFSDGKYTHCDTCKGEQLIDLTPLKKHHIDGIRYTKGTGRMDSTNPVHQNEIDNILKLNIPPLKRARKSIIQNLRIALHKKYRNRRANFQKELNKWQEKDSPYCMVAITYLESKISSS